MLFEPYVRFHILSSVLVTEWPPIGNSCSLGMWKKSPQRVLSYYQLRGLVVQVNHLRFFPVIYDLLGASVRKITCVTLARGQP